MTTTEMPPAEGPDVEDQPDEPAAEPRRRWGRRRTDRPADERRPRPPESLAVTTVVRGLACFSLLAVWVLFYAFVLSGIQESRSQTVLYAQLREGLASAETPIGGPSPAGTPLFLLDIPRAGVRHAVVVEGTTSADLVAGPGHRSDTPLPGQAGVSVVMGRSVTYGGPLRDLSRLRAGDVITVTTGQGEFGFRVVGVRGAGDPLPAPLAQGQSRITFVSSTGNGWRTGWAPQQTIYVDAALTSGTVQPAPPGRAAAVVEAAQPMQGDDSQLVALVLWLQALLIVVVLTVWARARWGRWQTWLVSVPLVVACLYGATGAAMVMLPNLI